jgi:ribosomal protein S18 acetylase RimI-like enzyme
MSDMTIELMSVADYDEILELWKSDPGVEISVGDDREGIARYLQRNPTTSFVARHEGRIVGTILSGHDGRRGSIYHLVVGPECRGMGVGKQLLLQSLDALKQEGVSLCLIYVFEHNEIGNRFWRAQNWVKLESLHSYSYSLVD